MKRCPALAALLVAVSVLAQTWQRQEIDGEQVCVRNTGEQIPAGYVSPSYATARCNSFTIFESWLRTADAQGLVGVTASASGSGASTEEGDPAPPAPSTWTEVFMGDAAGDAVENTATSLTIIADSTNDLNNRTMLCQDVTTDQDWELKGTFPAPANWSGHIEDFTGFGLVFVEDTTTTTSEYWQVWRYHIGSAPEFKHDASAPAFPWDFVLAANPVGVGGWPLVLSYDDSQDDLRAGYSEDGGSTYIEFAQRVGDGLTFGANAAACVFGTSHLSGAQTTALVTGAVLSGTISWYTPGSPPAGPTWDTQVPNQSLTEGVAWSYDFTQHVTCGAPPCTYSQTGLPAMGGLSISSAGAGSGTPNSNDASASPFNVTVTVTDNNTDSADETFQVSVAASSGATFLIPTSQGTIDCSVPQPLSGGGTAVPSAGDAIVLDGVSRGPLVIRNCNGTPNSRITVTNDTSETGPLVIGRSSGGGGWLVVVDDSPYLTIDGSGGWSGSMGTCSGLLSWPTFGTPGTCGIQIRPTGTATPTGLLNPQGQTTFFTLQGVEGDGNGLAGIAWQYHDHPRIDSGYPYTTKADVVDWQEGIVITDTYTHDTATGSCMYLGQNYSPQAQDEWKLRDWEVSYNRVEGCGADGIKLKSGWGDVADLLIHHNHVSGVGAAMRSLAVGATDHSIVVFEGSGTVHTNFVVNNFAGVNNRNQLQGFIQNVPSSIGSFDFVAYNNVVADSDGNGIGVATTGSNAQIVPTIYNNTVVDADSVGINVNTNIGSGTVRDNIAVGSGLAEITTPAGVTEAGNIENDDPATQNFEDYMNDDFDLTVSSPANDAGCSGTPPAADFEDVTRTGTCDPGAFSGP